MKKVFSISLLILLIFGTQHLVAQINSLSVQNLSAVQIDEISDQDIQTYYQRGMDNGLSPEMMFRLLREKGLPEDELAKLKTRLESIGRGNPGTNSKKNTGAELKMNQTAVETDRSKKESNGYSDRDQEEMELVTADLSIYGAELFQTKTKVFEPNLRIATPAGYVIGPDDELVVNVFGFSEKTYNLTVSPEGTIFIPQVGPLFVSGLSIEQASSRIKNKLAGTIYKAISSGQTRVQVTLGKIRSIRVTVIGQAKKPGTLTVSSLTTLFNLLYLCGGPSDAGSYRQIELIRGNEVKRVADLYAFLSKGSQKDNLLLQDGDVIRIPYYKTRVSIFGRVKREGKYEMLENESFRDLLQYCGGFTDDAYRAAVTIYQLTDRERKIMDLESSRFENYHHQSSDVVLVNRIQNSFENKLSITGAVYRPGEYELHPGGLSLKDLIEKAGGLRVDVYKKRGSIRRQNDNQTPVQVSFNVDSVMNGFLNIQLRKNDSVNIYSIFELQNEAMVTIDGNIKRSGPYKWAEKMSLNDLILAAGGLKEPLEVSSVEIARPLSMKVQNENSNQQTEVINVELMNNTPSKDVALQPGDIVHIRQMPGVYYNRTVFVEGMVKNPGRYTLQMTNERISDVLQRSGGFRNGADSSAVVIRRLSKKIQSQDDRQRIFTKLLNIKSDSLNQSETMRNEIYKDYDKISIDLSRALSGPDAPENMVLEDGDVITIERNTNLVKVSGEVYFPTIVPFEEGASLKYYIQKSGSFTELARKSGTLVIYPDGKAKQVKHFLFFRSYPKVVSRSEIFVPQKSATNKTKVSPSEWAVILSSLGIIANVILNFNK